MAIAVVGVSVFTAGHFGWKAWRADWERRNPEAARIAGYEKVFDAAWRIVDQKYYDPNFDHARWRRLRDKYRPRVRDQNFAGGLYMNVLTNMMDELGTSHVAVSMPPPSEARTPEKARRSDGRETPDKVFGCGGTYLTLDLGFQQARLRRGDRLATVVADVRRDSPAEKAGIAPGDVVGRFRLQGRKGLCPRLVALIASPGQAPRVVSYDVTDRPPRSTHRRTDLASGVRVLSFDGFNRESARWVAENLNNAPPQGVILDLRLNGGGRVSVERQLLSQLLSEGLVTGREIAGGRERTRKTGQTKDRYDGPLVVLIGPGSASASESTAAALRYHRRALLVGDETAGALLMSRNFRLPDGGAVQVAIADVLTPDGRRLEGVGVKPDVQVRQTLAAIRAGRDLPVEAAERLLIEGRWRP